MTTDADKRLIAVAVLAFLMACCCAYGYMTNRAESIIEPNPLSAPIPESETANTSVGKGPNIRLAVARNNGQPRIGSSKTGAIPVSFHGGPVLSKHGPDLQSLLDAALLPFWWKGNESCC